MPPNIIRQKVLVDCNEKHTNLNYFNINYCLKKLFTLGTWRRIHKTSYELLTIIFGGCGVLLSYLCLAKAPLTLEYRKKFCEYHPSGLYYKLLGF